MEKRKPDSANETWQMVQMGESSTMDPRQDGHIFFMETPKTKYEKTEFSGKTGMFHAKSTKKSKLVRILIPAKLVVDRKKKNTLMNRTKNFHVFSR